MKRYAIYRITTGEFRTSITSYIEREDRNDYMYPGSIPIRSVSLYNTKREAQDLINILVQLPENGYARDAYGQVIQPTKIERCKEEYEIIEIEVNETTTTHP